MRVPGVGGPRQVLGAALAAMAAEGLNIEAVSPVVTTEPLGPSRRRYANGAAVVGSQLNPPGLLRLLQELEHGFGRRRGGEPWRARPLDLDIILWSGGVWRSGWLSIPHPHFRSRRFVLAPAASVAPDWRDPASGLTLAQLRARLDRPRHAP